MAEARTLAPPPATDALHWIQPLACLVLRWSDEEAMLADINGVEYGLTCSIPAQNLSIAHRGAARVEAGCA